MSLQTSTGEYLPKNSITFPTIYQPILLNRQGERKRKRKEENYGQCGRTAFKIDNDCWWKIQGSRKKQAGGGRLLSKNTSNVTLYDR